MLQVPVMDTGNWTPVFTCESPGNLALTFDQNESHCAYGQYVKLGPMVFVSFRLFFGISYTTASGSMKITGLPYPVANVTYSQSTGSFTFQGITKANYTQFGPIVFPGTQVIRFFAANQGQPEMQLAITDVPSGQQGAYSVMLEGSMWYLTNG